MTPELLQLLLQGGSTAILIWVVVGLREDLKEQRKEAHDDRLWMQNLLLYLVKKEEPDFDPQSMPGSPPSRTDIPIDHAR